MYGLLSFWFSSVDFASADKSEATVVATGLQIVNSATVCKLTHLDELRTAIVELLDQPSDGVDDTEKTVVGAAASGTDILVEFARGVDPASDTIKVGAQAVWSRVKAEQFCAALVAFELVTP